MSGPLCVLMVLDGYPPEAHGGAERLVHGWSRELAARGHEVWVLAGRIGAPAGPDEERAGYRVRWWSSRRRTFWDGYLSAVRSCGAAVRRLAAERPPDILHLHQGLSARSALGAGVPAPAVCTFHAPWRTEFAEDARAREAAVPAPLRPLYRVAVRLKAARIHQMEKTTLARSRAVAVVSAYSRRLLAEAHGIEAGEIRVLPAGADLERFFPVPEEERARLRGGLGFEGPTLLSVRRLVRRMGLDLLIRAMPAVLSRLSRARLVLAGTGPERGPLERLAADLGVRGAVRFAGFVPEEDLPGYYRAADLFVLPTRSLEGYGVATLEALASGTPVVGTSEGATPELLAPLEEGLICPAASPEAIAGAILRWLNDPQALAALRSRCRAHVERNYRWEEGGRALEDFYRDVIAGVFRPSAG